MTAPRRPAPRPAQPCGRRKRCPPFACGIILAVAAAAASAADAQPEAPQLTTNQSYIESVTRPSTLAIDDPMAVFAFVLGSLPDRVTVYPTENYYYFAFVHRGVPYNGNIRLDASDRDQGKVHFAYAEDMAEWRAERPPLTYRLLGASQGVSVERLERLLYRVSYAGRSVLFALNDLTDIRPPAEAMAADEIYVGPVADESGLRFFLVFNERLKIFLYILDETAPVADGFEAAPRSDRILVGKRTGYAFYRDHRHARKILIGVFLMNARLNNYFDGPFDQLPDNFIAGETFRTLLLKAEPSLRGKIDRFGGSADGAQRHMIAPYYYYANVDELIAFHRCATDPRIPTADYYACFVADDKSRDHFRLLPLAVKKLRGSNGGPRR